MVERLPGRFVRAVRGVFGAEGEEWLLALPALLETCRQRWGLTVGPPFPDLSYHYVAPAVRADGSEVVLKAGPPHAGLRREMAALRHYGDRGVVQLVEGDEEMGVMLLERLRPGDILAEVADDDEATLIAARLMQRLWRPLPEVHEFRPVTEWAAGLERLRPYFGGGTGPFPAGLVEQAEVLFAELLGSAERPVLLHGDLHHWNILRATRQPWLVIDPKGVTGEPAYEVGTFLRNRLPETSGEGELKRLLERRVDLLQEVLGFERERIVGYGLAQTVLSAWWLVEDKEQGWEWQIYLAEIFGSLMV